MAHSDKSAVVLTGMIIAAIYVIMLVGLTRTSYFIGGAALQRVPAPEIVAMTRSVPPPAAIRAACVAAEVRTKEPQDCALAAGRPQRLPDLPPDRH